MIETLSNISRQPQSEDRAGKPVDDQIAQGFSFDAAMMALNGRAAHSLDAFGATPDTQFVNGAASNSDAAQNRGTDRSTNASQQSADQPTKTAAAMARSAATEAQQPATPSLLTTPQTDTGLAQLQMNAGAATMQTTAAVQPPRTNGQPLDAMSANRFHDAKADALKKPAASAPTQTAPKTEEFAKLLAQRLDTGATRFELRLDPPELGKVEAQLNVSDDGDTVMALKFENQAALDLFARDQSALRAVLAAAGFELGQEQLSFSLASEQPSDNQTGHDTGAIPVNIEQQFSAASAMTAHSRGMIDIWI